MTDQPPRPRRWGSILSRVPESGPPGATPDNVVPFQRETLDDLEAQLRQAQNKVVDKGAGVDLAARAYNTALDELKQLRGRSAERLKESGVVATFPMEFPELDDDGA